MNKPLQVGIYVRVSTLDQSCELQSSDLNHFASARGWVVYKVYEDHGRSGTNSNRPRLKTLMEDAKQRKFDILLCWKLDRLFRSLKDLISTLQELSELGIDFISLKDNIDLTTSSGRLMMHLLGAFAEFEASLIRERVRAGLNNARTKGIRLGRPRLRNDVRITSLRERGLSVRQIATQLGTSIGSVQRAIAATGVSKTL